MFVTETRLGETLHKVKLIDEGQAWVEAITPSLQHKIIEDWIRGDQLFKKGVDENDDVLGFYSITTQQLSGGRKKAGSHYTLFDTGQFYRSIFLRVLRDAILIDADFSEMPTQNWWNINNLDEEKILGLNEENLGNFTKAVANGYADYLRRILGVN
jgi:hypothetical protein